MPNRRSEQTITGLEHDRDVNSFFYLTVNFRGVISFFELYGINSYRLNVISFRESGWVTWMRKVANEPQRDFLGPAKQPMSQRGKESMEGRGPY